MAVPANLATGDLINEAWVDDVVNELTALPSRYVAVPTAWTAVTFQNSWVNWATGSNACQYRKEGDRVFIRGMMKSGTMGNVIAFALPAGFRPPADVYLPTVSNGLFGYMNIIAADGSLRPQVGANAWYSVECSFSTVA